MKSSTVALTVPFTALLAASIFGCAVDAQTSDMPPETASPEKVGTQMYDPNPTPSPIANPPPPAFGYVDLVPTIEQVGPGVIYPVIACAENKGNVASTATTIQVGCSMYKNGAYVGPCLSAISEPLPSINPGAMACPELPWTPLLSCHAKQGNVASAVTNCKVSVTVGPSSVEFNVTAQ